MSSLPPPNPASNPFGNSATYLMACHQLRSVAREINLEEGITQRLMFPKRSQVVAVPVRMEDGRTETFVGYRVQHSLTSGPSKGGLRYAKNVDLGEVAALAMWMSWKCGIMNLPYGGAKGGIAVDPAELRGGEKERLTRRFTDEIQNIIGPRIDVMAPDMGTDEQTMAWIYDTYSMKVGYACPEIVTGKPVELGGCVGRKEATGRGVVFCISEALAELKINPEHSTAVVQGFGNVGSVTCEELVKIGVKVIAIGDRYGAIRNDRGINVAKLLEYQSKNERKTIAGFPEAEQIPDSELLITPCTVLVPAAMERVVNAENAGKLRCRVLAEGANGPTDPDADAILARTDTYLIPDILCNAGGVTVSYFEWVQDLAQFMWDENRVKAELKKLMLNAFARVRSEAKRRNVTNRTAALCIGVQKVANEKAKRGLYP
jgi:glutamate dehydrogenase (NAD(P)+)